MVDGKAPHCPPRALTDRLRDYSNSQGGTFFITTLAAFLAFLHRLTGERDLSVGSPLAGRNRTELENLIGQFLFKRAAEGKEPAK